MSDNQIKFSRIRFLLPAKTFLLIFVIQNNYINIMDKINLKVPAKINLFLRVLDKRSDGYHNIDSVMQTINLYDDLTLEKSDNLELICEDLPNLPAESNLAYKAAEIVSQQAYIPGVKIVLKKAIPSGAGLGGGSADAAFVIRGLMSLYKLNLDIDQLLDMSTSLGADVPFFLGRGQARVGGIGNIMQDIRLPLSYRILVVKPPFSVDTSTAYVGLDRLREGKFSLTNDRKNTLLHRNLTDHDFVRIAKTFINDLEEIVFSWYSELIQVKKYLLDAGAFHAGMSGSGSSVFGLFTPDNRIDETARRLTENNYLVFNCKPVLLPPASISN